MTQLTFALERWALSSPFRFAGYLIEALDVAYVQVSRGGVTGQGEGVVPIVFDITAEQTRQQLEHAQHALQAGLDIQALCADMPAGPARNALDCALWDLRAKTQGRSIWDLAGLPSGPHQLLVDQTIGLDTPEAMGQAAAASQHAVLKIKADAHAVMARIEAVRAARPDAELLVDANQSWSADDLHTLGPGLQALGVVMIEQPLPRGQDQALRDLACPVPIYADESCHTRADLPALKGLYQGINIKLDKTGGLTEALALAREAQRDGFGLMVGCMAGTSLSMAPAYVIGTLANWADLDGPLLLAQDRAAPMTYQHGKLALFSPELWG